MIDPESYLIRVVGLSLHSANAIKSREVLNADV